MIRLDVEIPEEFVYVILQDWCWVVHIPFVWSNFNFLHDSQWITSPTQSCLILYSFCTNLLHSCEMSLISRFKRPEVFFPILFSSYCRSVVPRVVSIVSGRCNLSSSAFFYLVFKSLYWCVSIVFNADKSFFLFFWTHRACMCHLLDVRPYAWSLVFFFSRMVPNILRGGQPWYLFLWQGFCYIVLSWVTFWFFWNILSDLFISSPLVWWCQLPIFPCICWFAFLRAF